MIELRPYQQNIHDKTLEELKVKDKVLVQLPTGAGKSINISFLANSFKGRTLILCHRIEILNQNKELINNIGELTSKTKGNEFLKLKKVVIAMSQTAHARFKKFGKDYIGEFDNIIIDEVHFEIFKKVYDKLDYKKLIAYTATPILNKKETIIIDGLEYTRQKTLSNEFEVLIEGISELELIDLGYLVKDFNVELQPPNIDKLIKSERTPDGYTNSSLTRVFGSNTSTKNLLLAYKKYCVGKKVIIFNPNTATNLKVLESFKKEGFNAKSFDSVNKNELNRKETVDWFSNSKDAILINTNVFVTGFNSKEVEVIIFNRKTKSLSTYLQAVGRASRPSQKIYKDKFLLIDCGLNLRSHGKWSKKRNWQYYFKPKGWKLKQQIDIIQTWECKQCMNLNRSGTCLDEQNNRLVCCNCGATKPPKKEGKKINGKFKVMDEPSKPNAKKIIEYVIANELGSAAVFNIFTNQVLDLFAYHTDEIDYYKNQARYKKRVAELFRPIYFSVLNNGELQGKNRRYETELSRVLSKVDKKYIN